MGIVICFLHAKGNAPEQIQQRDVQLMFKNATPHTSVWLVDVAESRTQSPPGTFRL